jgi:putative FmdB family regulatory protein
MPIFDFHCSACGTFEAFLHPTEPIPRRCMHCGAKGLKKLFMTSPPRVLPDVADWSNENSGRGRFCPQAARRPGDPKAHFTSRQALEDWGKAKGYTVNRS